MIARGFVAVAIGLLSVVALVQQVPGLAQRPMHADEAVHADRFGTLLEEGAFVYDPTEFHGPSLYYLSLPSAWLRGKSDYVSLDETDLRLVPVVAGVGLIAGLALLAGGVGRLAVVVAGALTLLSSTFVYYNRYYIHETLLVLFTLLLIGAGWRYWRSGGMGWAILAGVALGLMHATKETSIIAWTAMAGAVGLCGLWHWQAIRERGVQTLLPEHMRGRDVGLGLGCAAVVSVVLFSALFTHWRGPIDSVLTWLSYLGRGAGTAGDAEMHVHPWYYYLELLLYWRHDTVSPVWSQALIVGLALVGGGNALLPRRVDAGGDPALVRFLLFFTLLMLMIYSAIPYKTPWLVMGMLHGMILLAGVGAIVLLRLVPWLSGWKAIIGMGWRVAVAGGLAFGFMHLHEQVEMAIDERFAADPRNPWVYAHTLRNVDRLVDRVDDIASVHPQGQAMLVRVMAPNPWPLPWYLREYSNVGYWPTISEEIEAPMIIVRDILAPELQDRLDYPTQREFFGLRPEVHVLTFTRKELWEEFLETRR